MKTPQESADECSASAIWDAILCDIPPNDPIDGEVVERFGAAITAARSEGRKAALEHAAGIASDELTKHALVNIEARSKGDKSGCESTDSVGAQSVGAMRALSTVEKAIRASAAQPKPEVT